MASAFKFAFRFAPAAATLGYGIQNAKRTEHAAQVAKQSAAGLSPTSDNMHERIQARAASQMSVNTTSSAIHGFGQRFDPDKLAIPRLKPIQTAITAIRYTRETSSAEKQADSITAAKKGVMNRVEKLSDLPSAVGKAASVASKTGLSELNGGREKTMQSVGDLMGNVKVVGAKQASVGLGISAILAGIPHPAARVASLGMMALTAGRLGHTANAVSDVLGRDKGALLTTMEDRLAQKRQHVVGK
jgi:hypothetical protein